MDIFEFIYGGPDNIKCVLKTPIKEEIKLEDENTKPIISIISDFKPDTTNWDMTTTYSVQRMDKKMIIVKDIEHSEEKQKIKSTTKQHKRYRFDKLKKPVDHTPLLQLDCIQIKTDQQVYRAEHVERNLNAKLIHSQENDNKILNLKHDKGDANVQAVKSALSMNGFKTYQCNICNTWFLDVKKFTVHLLGHTEPEPKNISCEICNKYFRTIDKLNAHKATHKLFDCTICKKQIKGEYSFREHIKNHVVQRIFTCQICYEDFKSRHAFRRHTVTHTGKSYECYLCSKAFVTFESLRAHFIIHSRRKLNRCTICDKTFLRRTYLKIHKRAHLKKKFYVCDICDKKYNSDSGLRKHRRVVHD